MKVQELLKVPSPENRLMLLQLGMNETARSLVVEALSHAENYPLILKCLSAWDTDGMERAEKVRDDIINIVASVQESCGG